MKLFVNLITLALFASISLQSQEMAFAQVVDDDGYILFIPPLIGAAKRKELHLPPEEELDSRPVYLCKTSEVNNIQCNSSSTYYFWAFVGKMSWFVACPT
jgi:hypothetical protein